MRSKVLVDQFIVLRHLIRKLYGQLKQQARSLGKGFSAPPVLDFNEQNREKNVALMLHCKVMVLQHIPPCPGLGRSINDVQPKRHYKCRTSLHRPSVMHAMSSPSTQTELLKRERENRERWTKALCKCQLMALLSPADEQAEKTRASLYL